jgi:hypothetical protein
MTETSAQLPRLPIRLFAMAVGLAGLLALSVPPAQAHQDRAVCAATTDQVLAQEGIAAEEVRKVAYTTRYSGKRAGGRVQEYVAWVSLRDQPGQLVVVMTRHCGYDRHYWQGRADS